MDRCRSSGFTLTEVLVALAVVAIALLAAGRAASLATASAAEVKLHTLARWVAENRLAELTAARVWPAFGATAGTERQAGVEFRWRVEILPTPHPGFRRVEVSVARVEDPQRELHRLIGVVARPH